MNKNTEIIRDYSKRVWEERDLSIIDNVFAPDCKIHSPFSTIAGKETMKEIVDKWLAAFPDMQVTWEDFVAENDKVVSRWRACGTHLGGFFDTKPTHKEITFSGVITYRLAHGKVIEYWSLVDVHSILSQLEAYDTIEQVLEQ